MILSKIKSEDLLFSGEIEDDRTNTYLNLCDYDWMDYSLITRFRTEELGLLNVKFNYFGLVTSTMVVEQTLNDITQQIIYEYSTDIFEKHIVKYLKKHIHSWEDKYAFNGEEEVIDFFNDVLDNGKIISNK